MKKLIVFLFLFGVFTHIKAQVADSAQRKVKVKGAANFRDLGGYKTRNGHHVRWAKLYRSADMSKLTDSDLSLMQNLKISYDIDLRGVAESQKAPDKMLPGMHYQLCPAGSDNVDGMMRSIAVLKNPKQADSLMEDFYSKAQYFKDRYKPLFDALLDLPQDQSLVFHCTAGKDRTGMGAALVLYALGVPYKEIVEDFLASNYYRKADNDKMMNMMVNTYHLNAEVAKSMMGVKKEYIDATFSSIKKKFGSVDSFLKTEIGLDDSKIKTLREKFLD